MVKELDAPIKRMEKQNAPGGFSAVKFFTLREDERSACALPSHRLDAVGVQHFPIRRDHISLDVGAICRSKIASKDGKRKETEIKRYTFRYRLYHIDFSLVEEW